MEVKILDEILEYLLFIENFKKPYCVGLDKRDVYFDKYENSFLKLALSKLLKDEYIRLGTNVKIETISRSQFISFCHITFDGCIFINSGGYTNQISEIQKQQSLNNFLQNESFLHSQSLVSLNRWLVFLTWIIALGTLIAAIYYILEALAFLGVLQTKKT